MVVDLEQKGDLLIRDVWGWGTDCIQDTCVVSTDVESYLKKKSAKSLVVEKRDKNCNYLDSCMNQKCQFSPLVISIDGIMGT